VKQIIEWIQMNFMTEAQRFIPPQESIMLPLFFTD